jgi:hypothetical protein
VTPSILAKPIESQPAEITQLFLSQPLRVESLLTETCHLLGGVGA